MQKKLLKRLSCYKTSLSRVFDIFKEAIFPKKCLVCGSFFHSPQYDCSDLPKKNLIEISSLKVQGQHIFEILMASFLCPVCSAAFLPVNSPYCSVCGNMFKSREGKNHVCGDCLTSPKMFRKARAAGIYDLAFKSVIHCFKYRGKTQLARPLGTLLFNAFVESWDKNSIDIILPVPLHIKKLRKRGFNQAYLLVKDWTNTADDLDDEQPCIDMDRHVLVRSRWTKPQTGLGRKKRIANIKNAFCVTNIPKVRGKKILIVDDVYTTGTTVNECAKTLMDSGAVHVDVLTLARTLL